MTGDKDFQIAHFADFEQFKFNVHFANFGQVRTAPISPLLLTVDRSQLFCLVWVRHAAKDNTNSLCVIKIQEPCIGSGASYFQ